MKYNKDNYFIESYGIFKQIKSAPKREPDFISNTGSKYWYFDNKIIRESDHWSGFFEGHSKNPYGGCIRVSTCKWYLRLASINKETYEDYVGEIEWKKLKKATIKKKRGI